MIRELVLVLIGCVLLVLVLMSFSQPKLTVTVSPDIENAAKRIVHERPK